MILTMIWTSVQSNGKSPQSALGKDWDMFCEMEELKDSELIKFHQALVDIYQDDANPLPPFFNKLPPVLKNVIFCSLAKNEKNRPDMFEIHQALFENSIVRGGKTYKFSNYMNNLEDLEFECTIVEKAKIPETIATLTKLWLKNSVQKKFKKTNLKVKKSNLKRVDSNLSVTSSTTSSVKRANTLKRN